MEAVLKKQPEILAQKSSKENLPNSYQLGDDTIRRKLLNI